MSVDFKVKNGLYVSEDATIKGNVYTTGNTTTGNLTVSGASVLGTVASGTWRGTSITTTYTDAKIASVSNSYPLTATTSNDIVSIGMLTSNASTGTYGSGANIPVFTIDAYGRITGVTETAVSVTSTGGYVNSTLGRFPGAITDYDYGDLSQGDSSDSFGVSLVSSYDCMEPAGSLVSEDIGALA